MVNLMREHVPQTARLHYVITDGGAAPNIVPETAQVYYYVRHPEKEQVVALFERVVKAAQAAAMGTGTEVKVEVIHGNYPVLPNQTLAEMVYDNLVTLGGIQYSPAEQEFAQTLHQTLIHPRRALGSEQSVSVYKVRQSMGSTDVGDVSWLVPTVGFTTATWVPGTPAHSWQAVAAGGMSIGHKGMDLAARLLAKSAAQLMMQPQIIAQAKAELKEAQGPDFVYSALLQTETLRWTIANRRQHVWDEYRGTAPRCHGRHRCPGVAGQWPSGGLGVCRTQSADPAARQWAAQF